MMFWGVPGGFDQSYVIYLIIAITLPLLAQMYLKSTFANYKQVRNSSGLTGAETARQILDRNGLYKVPVVEVGGRLSDHYDPRDRVVRLSSDIYRGRSVASVAVAAHEVGHAIQHQEAYGPLSFRSTLFPLANIASRFGMYAVFIGLFAEIMGLAMFGILLVGITVLFQLVTLPVEFNASSRAMLQLEQFGILHSREEQAGARKVLSAAAWTYVAGTIVAVAELLRLLFVLNNRNSRRN